MSVASLTLRRPDDWHVHFRDGEMLKLVVPYTAQVFSRAIVMPNLTPAIISKTMAGDYRRRIFEAVPPGVSFAPLMTLYLTDNTDLRDLREGFQENVYTAAKLYPAHVTTNSARGVKDVKNVYPALKAMAEIGMPLLVHGEAAEDGIDIFDREKVFLEKTLLPLMKEFHRLKIVLEHVTTSEGVQFVREHSTKYKIAATITPHHLHINRNAMFKGGMRPHFYCLPVAKREEHRQALVQAATSGEACFFLGSDSAPHPSAAKESACGCAGIFCAPNALQLYAEIFEQQNALDKLEAFASLNGPKFYGLPANDEKITLVQEQTDELAALPLSEGGQLLPFALGTKRRWKIRETGV